MYLDIIFTSSCLNCQPLVAGLNISHSPNPVLEKNLWLPALPYTLLQCHLHSFDFINPLTPYYISVRWKRNQLPSFLSSKSVHFFLHDSSPKRMSDSRSKRGRLLICIFLSLLNNSLKHFSLNNPFLRLFIFSIGMTICSSGDWAPTITSALSSSSLTPLVSAIVSLSGQCKSGLLLPSADVSWTWSAGLVEGDWAMTCDFIGLVVGNGVY